MEFKEKIRRFIIEEVSLDGTVKDLVDDDLLIERGIIDSMGILSLLAFLEENFGILLQEGEINVENFATLRSICNVVSPKLAQG